MATKVKVQVLIIPGYRDRKCGAHHFSDPEVLQSGFGANLKFGMANFRKIARKILSEFLPDNFLANVLALFLQGFRPPPPQKKSHAQNCRQSLNEWAKGISIRSSDFRVQVFSDQMAIPCGGGGGGLLGKARGRGGWMALQFHFLVLELKITIRTSWITPHHFIFRN